MTINKYIASIAAIVLLGMASLQAFSLKTVLIIDPVAKEVIPALYQNISDDSATQEKFKSVNLTKYSRYIIDDLSRVQVVDFRGGNISFSSEFYYKSALKYADYISLSLGVVKSTATAGGLICPAKATVKRFSHSLGTETFTKQVPASLSISPLEKTLTVVVDMSTLKNRSLNNPDGSYVKTFKIGFTPDLQQ